MALTFSSRPFSNVISKLTLTLLFECLLELQTTSLQGDWARPRVLIIIKIMENCKKKKKKKDVKSGNINHIYISMKVKQCRSCVAWCQGRVIILSQVVEIKNSLITVVNAQVSVCKVGGSHYTHLLLPVTHCQGPVLAPGTEAFVSLF